MDILYANPSDPKNDQALADSLARTDNVTLAVQSRIGEGKGKQDTVMPLAPFLSATRQASIGVYYNWQGAAWSIPYAEVVQGKTLPSLAASMAGKRGKAGSEFPVDYSFDIDSVPRVSAVDLLDGKVSSSKLAGKTVVFGVTAFRAGDQYIIPGRSKQGGVFIHIIGAETLKAGHPIDLGWWPALLVAAGASVWALRKHKRRVLGWAALGILAVPVLLEWRLIFIDVMPALFLVGVLSARLAWARSRSRGLVNNLTGLPNLAALAADSSGKDLPLVAVRVHNYAEIASTLDAAGERQFIEQIVARLTLGQEDRRIYQGDEGIFAWFTPKGTPFASHLDALHVRSMEELEADIIRLAIGHYRGRMTEVARRLGIGRSTLYRKLGELGIDTAA